jgi:glycosyltransferase involved in cell wall biosynthesis
MAAGAAAWRMATAAWRVGRVLRREDVDIVHANSIRDGLIASLGSLWHRRSVVWSVHDFPPGGVLGRLVRLAASHVATVVVANSEAVRRDFQQGSLGRMELVYPVLPPSAFRAPGGESPRAEWGIPATALVMGYVGQITPWKRVRDAILGCRGVFEKCDRAWLLIVGEPKFRPENAQYFRELQGLVETLGVGNRVRFVGFQQNVDRVFQCLDVLVHPAEREPFGRVVAEAMARGIPVVATDSGGIPEIVEDGQTGLLFPVGDIEALSELLLRLCADEALRSRLGAAGRASARRFEVEQAVTQTLEVYERVLLASSFGREGRR